LNIKAKVYVKGDWLRHVSKDKDKWRVAANMGLDVRVLLETLYTVY